MKNIINYIPVLLIACIIISFSSCDKITRDLGKATSSGENTMGFYVGGQAVKIKGEFQRGGLTSGPYGVDCGIINGKFIDVYGVSKDPRFYLNITVPVDSLNRDGEYRLQRAWNGKDEAAISDDSNFGGNH